MKIGKKLLLWLGLPGIALLLVLLIVISAASALLDEAAAVVGADITATSEAGRILAQFAQLGGSDGDGDDTDAGYGVYSGTDDTDTDFSRRVLRQTARWSNSHNPCDYGYGGRCEAWVYDIYAAAGIPCSGWCCAYRHAMMTATTEGEIPKGALIFSGRLSDGTLYENNYRASAWCDICQHYAGHVAIYIGGGKVVGAQYPYIQSINAWISVYGYGGWSTF